MAPTQYWYRTVKINSLGRTERIGKPEKDSQKTGLYYRIVRVVLQGQDGLCRTFGTEQLGQNRTICYCCYSDEIKLIYADSDILMKSSIYI
jgi:hypothetical protein